MSTRYKFVDNKAVYFTTSTVVGWTDIFTREIYKTILVDSMRHCQLNQGIIIHARILMTNHFAYHLQL
jgi:putative transposase